MLEIKFRAWDTLGKDMMYDVAVMPTDVRSKTLSHMQFTGLRDKNGKEIYEGDFVTNGGIKAEVKYAVGCTGFVLRADKGYMLGPLTNWENIEVVGNIHENPELLA